MVHETDSESNEGWWSEKVKLKRPRIIVDVGGGNQALLAEVRELFESGGLTDSRLLVIDPRVDPSDGEMFEWLAFESSLIEDVAGEIEGDISQIWLVNVIGEPGLRDTFEKEVLDHVMKLATSGARILVLDTYTPNFDDLKIRAVKHFHQGGFDVKELDFYDTDDPFVVALRKTDVFWPKYSVDASLMEVIYSGTARGRSVND